MVSPSQVLTEAQSRAVLSLERKGILKRLPSPKCRACGQQNLQSVLDLGNVPLSNAFLDAPDAPEERYPLELAFCPHCALVQITETIAPEKLFSQYLYFSSVSQTMLQHAEQLANDLISERGLTKDSLVMELASNDGYLLQYFKKAGIPVLGIDPAQNIAAQANAAGIPTICEFFGEQLALMLPKADVVIANNVLGHVADLNGFVLGIKRVLKPNGAVVIEVPYVRDMIWYQEFDTIYFEHLSYFSVTSLVNLFRDNGLQLVDVRRVWIHGGSLQLLVTHVNPFVECKNVVRMLTEEREMGVDRMDYYRDFAAKVQSAIAFNPKWLRQFKKEGKKIIGYGAAAKGVMFLNVMGLGTETIDYVVDATPAKQGKYMPGVHIPIVPPEQIGDPDYILILAWNWEKEIKAKHPEFKGRWISFYGEEMVS